MTRLGVTWNLTLKIEADKEKILKYTLTRIREELAKQNRKTCSVNIVAEELDEYRPIRPKRTEPDRDDKLSLKDLTEYKWERRGKSLSDMA